MKTNFKAVKSVITAVTVVAAMGLSACSTGKTNTQANNAEYDRTPAQAKGAELFLEGAIKKISQSSSMADKELAEQKINTYIRKSAARWNIPEAKEYGKPGVKISAESEALIAKKLVLEAAEVGKIAKVKTGIVSSYAKSAESTGSWSTVGAKTNYGNLKVSGASGGSIGVKALDEAAAKIENTATRELASSAAKSVIEIGESNPALKNVTREIAEHSVAISKLSGKPYLGTGCKTLDGEALTNLKEITVDVENSVKAGEKDLVAANKRAVAKVTEEHPELVCAERINPAIESCEVFHSSLKCK